MKQLAAYIKEKNALRRTFFKEQIDVDNLTVEVCNTLMEDLNYDLSPENLTCDGELSGAELVNESLFLTQAKIQLEAIMEYLS